MRAVPLAALLLAAPLLPAAAEDEAARGRALAERWCAECHVIAPEGPGADAAPAFPNLARRTDAELRAWLADPHPPMPDPGLSGREIEALVAHIRAVTGAD